MSNSLDDLDQETLEKALVYGAIGFGALALLSPTAFHRLYLTPSEQMSPATQTMTRLWGTRTAVVGALASVLEGDARKNLLRFAAMNSAVDSAVIATTKDSPLPAKVLGVATTAGFGAVQAYLSTQD